MVIQLGNLEKTRCRAALIGKTQMVCIKNGKYGLVQGDLVWELNGLACVRVFSKCYVGRRA